MLMTPNKEVWLFTAQEYEVVIEDSVYLAGSDGPRRTAQIVIHGQAGAAPRVLWAFQQATSATVASIASARRVREEEPKLPS